MVTSASEEICAKIVVAAETAFSVGVILFSSSSFAALSLSARSFSNPSLCDSVTTDSNAERISFWISTSSCLATSLAKTAFAVAKASRALATTEASACLAVESLDSKVAILASSIALFTFLVSSALTSGFASAVFSVSSFTSVIF